MAIEQLHNAYLEYEDSYSISYPVTAFCGDSPSVSKVEIYGTGPQVRREIRALRRAFKNYGFLDVYEKAGENRIYAVWVRIREIILN